MYIHVGGLADLAENKHDTPHSAYMKHPQGDHNQHERKR